MLQLPAELWYIIDSFLDYRSYLAVHNSCHTLQDRHTVPPPYDQEMFLLAIQKNEPIHLKQMMLLPKLDLDFTALLYFSESDFPDELIDYDEPPFCESGPKMLINYCILKKFFDCALVLLEHPDHGKMLDMSDDYNTFILNAAVILGADFEIVKRLFQFPDFVMGVPDLLDGANSISIIGRSICIRGDMDTSFGRGSSINPFTARAGSQIQEMTRQSNLMLKQAAKLDTSNALLADIRAAVKSFNLVPTYN